jgi:hypothetical protein
MLKTGFQLVVENVCGLGTTCPVYDFESWHSVQRIMFLHLANSRCNFPQRSFFDSHGFRPPLKRSIDCKRSVVTLWTVSSCSHGTMDPKHDTWESVITPAWHLLVRKESYSDQIVSACSRLAHTLRHRINKSNLGSAQAASSQSSTENTVAKSCKVLIVVLCGNRVCLCECGSGPPENQVLRLQIHVYQHWRHI